MLYPNMDPNMVTHYGSWELPLVKGTSSMKMPLQDAAKVTLVYLFILALWNLGRIRLLM